MSRPSLEPVTAAGGRRFGDSSGQVEGVPGVVIVSLALSKPNLNGGRDVLGPSLGLVPPKVGGSSTSDDGAICLLALQSDKLLLVCEPPAAMTVEEVAGRVGKTAYLTDQSDGWVALRLGGERASAALERLCPLDLHPSVFGVGAAARTTMMHMAVIIVRKPESFLLLTPRSMADTAFAEIRRSLTYVA